MLEVRAYYMHCTCAAVIDMRFVRLVLLWIAKIQLAIHLFIGRH